MIKEKLQNNIFVLAFKNLRWFEWVMFLAMIVIGAFYIVTDKKKCDIVKRYLLSIDGVGVTLMEAEGGYSNNDEVLLLAVVPSRSYFVVKDGLKEIDNKMFFLVCDSYEVSEKGDFS